MFREIGKLFKKLISDDPEQYVVANTTEGFLTTVAVAMNKGEVDKENGAELVSILKKLDKDAADLNKSIENGIKRDKTVEKVKSEKIDTRTRTVNMEEPKEKNVRDRGERYKS